MIYKIVLKVHDEINLNAREDLAELAASKLEEFMMAAAKRSSRNDYLELKPKYRHMGRNKHTTMWDEEFWTI